MLNPRRVRLLVELAERETISAVAAALHFTPSTVSHGLSTLEREVGVALLERDARRVRLTPAGQVLVREGRLALQRLSAAEADARAAGRLKAGRIAIGAFPSAGATIGVAALQRIREAHPRVEVELVHVEPETALPGLSAGMLDVAIVYTHPELSGPDIEPFEAVELMKDPIRVALPPGHPAAALDRVPFERLEDERFIGGEQFVRAMCRAYGGFEAQIASRSADVALSCALVNAGVGVSIMPQLLADTVADPGAMRDLDPMPAPRSLLALHRRGAAALPATEAAIAALVTASEERPPTAASGAR